MLDGGRRPRFIWPTTEVTIKPLSEVDEAFAWDEGKGTGRETGGSMPIAAISLGRERVKASRQTTKCSLCSSASRLCGRSMSPIWPTASKIDGEDHLPVDKRQSGPRPVSGR